MHRLGIVLVVAACSSSHPDGGSAAPDAAYPPDSSIVQSGGCFADGEVPPAVEPSGIAVPSLEDERNAYRRWGWTWSPEAEPDFAADASYAVADPDIHGDTEGDDLWSYTLQHARTGQAGYRDRATAWARYFKTDYAQCVGSSGASFCYDRDAFGADHLWGWGLLAWYRATQDQAALDAAKQIGAVLEQLWSPASPFGCLPSSGCTTYGVRQIGRHLLFATRLAEVTADARWVTLRDKIIDKLLASSDWDATRGMYFLGEWSTDSIIGTDGAYAAGTRIQSAFQIGVLSEAMDHAYRVTKRPELRARMIAMAKFVATYGLDPTYQYTGSTFGIRNGAVWHSYSATTPVTYWDPVYTTSLVNTLVRGYRYTCDTSLYEQARHFFERGTKGIYGEPTRRSAPDGVVAHFVDSQLDSSSGNFYLGFNKGELQYTYLLFAPM